MNLTDEAVGVREIQAQWERAIEVMWLTLPSEMLEANPLPEIDGVHRDHRRHFTGEPVRPSVFDVAKVLADIARLPETGDELEDR